MSNLVEQIKIALTKHRDELAILAANEKGNMCVELIVEKYFKAGADSRTEIICKLAQTLSKLMEYHELSKGDMYRRNFNWLLANEAVADLKKELGIE